MLDHDAIYEIYEAIVKPGESDFEKFLNLQTKYGIQNIEDLCRNFDDEDIFIYVKGRLDHIVHSTYAFQEYLSYTKQLRASYRGQIYKENKEEGKKNLK